MQEKQKRQRLKTLPSREALQLMAHGERLQLLLAHRSRLLQPRSPYQIKRLKVFNKMTCKKNRTTPAKNAEAAAKLNDATIA